MIDLETLIGRVWELEGKYQDMVSRYQELIYEYEELKGKYEKRLQEDEQKKTNTGAGSVRHRESDEGVQDMRGSEAL